MKLQSYSILVPLTAGLLLVAGCNKSEPTAAQPASAPEAKAPALPAEVKAATTAAVEAIPAATTAVKAQTETVQAVAATAATNAQVQTANLTSKTQSMIESAQKMLADRNWSDAVKLLNDLANMKLTPQQQAIVDGLKQQAQNLGQEAVANKATEQGAKAVGDLLKK